MHAQAGIVRADGTMVLSFEVLCPYEFRTLEPAGSRTVLLDGLVQVHTNTDIGFRV